MKILWFVEQQPNVRKQRLIKVLLAKETKRQKCYTITYVVRIYNQSENTHHFDVRSFICFFQTRFILHSIRSEKASAEN